MMDEVINIPEYPDCEERQCQSTMYETYEIRKEKYEIPKKSTVTPHERNLRVSPAVYDIKKHKYDFGENEWTEDITNTIVKWKDDIAKNSFIYGELLERKVFSMQGILIFTLILSIFMTILSSISVALTSLNISINFQWVIFSFNVIILVASGVITGLNGAIKVFSIDDDIKIFTRIIEKLDTLWFVFETELNKPSKDRQNAKDFITKVDGDYMHLMQICPHVSVNDYVRANKSYQESLSNNLIWQHKFRKEVEEKLK